LVDFHKIGVVVHWRTENRFWGSSQNVVDIIWISDCQWYQLAIHWDLVSEKVKNACTWRNLHETGWDVGRLVQYKPFLSVPS